jgi:heme exporter protein C
MGSRPYRWTQILGTLSLLGMLIAPYMALVHADVEKEMLLAQKIFYFHVPSAYGMYLGFFLTFVFSSLYLWKKEKQWDRWASCSAEVGLLFCTVVLVTGCIWAKPIWGAWWVWDPQLTLVLVMWLIFVAYGMLRSYSDDPLSSAKFRAVLGIIGFLDAPLIHVSVKLWRGQHPSVVRGERVGLPPDMLEAFLFCSIVFLILFATILFKRVSIERARDELESIKAHVRDRQTILGRAFQE